MAFFKAVWYCLKLVFCCWMVWMLTVHFVDLNVYIHTNPGDVPFLLTSAGLMAIYLLVNAVSRVLGAQAYGLSTFWLTVKNIVQRQRSTQF